ncbi:related to TIM44 - mitochondrial inner membrane import receptor subunit [Ustilago trichophora]|uniref:Mitochondrial import inner membrane translocase subunit TIM44 n=1 Tax=Ustilago trichophora TaxID=86804 RepID=A0A5C3EPD3_9BASI|nr:related to TIM44 - mitochondrial inner membrane import receptor subunit [Ustilago trichophora]
MVRPTPTMRIYLASRASSVVITPRRTATAIATFNSPALRTFSTTHRRFDSPRSPFAVFVETLKAELRKNQELQENMRQLSGDVGKMQDSETMKKMRDAYERARIITSIKENPKLQAAADALRKSGGQVGDAVGATLKQMEESELIKGLGAISSRLARGLEDSTAPIRNTEAYKQLSETLTEAFDDGGSALRIYVDKDKDVAEVRRIKREARLRKIGRPMPSKDVDSKEAADAVMQSYAIKEEEEAAAAAAEAAAAEEEAAKQANAKTDGAEEAKPQAAETESKPVEESSSSSSTTSESASTTTANPSNPPKKPAGYAARTRTIVENPTATSLVLAPEPAYRAAWSNFKSSNPLFRRLSDLSEAYHESENPVVERVRSVTDWFGSLFDENDFVRVTRSLKTLDPSFNLESFQRDLREYIVPEIIDSYHTAARHLLRQWCGEATFNLLMATIDPYVSKGYIPEGRLLDLKQVEILQAKILDNNVPVLVVSFTTQELMFFKDPKTGDVKAGNDSQPDLCRYAMVLTRVEDELDNEITGGWKVVELARRGQTAYL